MTAVQTRQGKSPALGLPYGNARLSITAMRLVFHRRGHPDQPLHGMRYYSIIGAALVVLGLLYLFWTT
jgi:hypothetical protein